MYPIESNPKGSSSNTFVPESRSLNKPSISYTIFSSSFHYVPTFLSVISHVMVLSLISNWGSPLKPSNTLYVRNLTRMNSLFFDTIKMWLKTVDNDYRRGLKNVKVGQWPSCRRVRNLFRESLSLCLVPVPPVHLLKSYLSHIPATNNTSFLGLGYKVFRLNPYLVTKEPCEDSSSVSVVRRRLSCGPGS